MRAVDRINFRENYSDRQVSGGYTLKEAYETLWNEVLRNNSSSNKISGVLL